MAKHRNTDAHKTVPLAADALIISLPSPNANTDAAHGSTVARSCPRLHLLARCMTGRVLKRQAHVRDVPLHRNHGSLMEHPSTALTAQSGASSNPSFGAHRQPKAVHRTGWRTLACINYLLCIC